MATIFTGQAGIALSPTPSLQYGNENVKFPLAIDFMLAGQNAPHTVDGLGAPAIADYLNSHTTAGEVIATDAMPDDIIQERISNMENNLNVILANIGLGLDFTGLQAVDGIVAAEE